MNCISSFGIFSIRYHKYKAKNKLKVHPVSRKLHLRKGISFHTLSFFAEIVGPRFKFVTPDSNRMNLRYNQCLLNWNFDWASWGCRISNIYFFQLAQKCEIYCPLKKLLLIFILQHIKEKISGAGMGYFVY